MNRILNLSRFLASIETASPCKMTLQKLAFLSCVEKEPLKTADICALMGVTQATASRSMEDLVENGLAKQVSEEYAAPYTVTAEGANLLWDLEGAMDLHKTYDPPAIKRKVQYSKEISATTRPLRSMPDDVIHKVHGPAPHTRSWL